MNEENSFLNETIKEKPLYKRQPVRAILWTVGLAVLFGIVSCAVFVAVRPQFEAEQGHPVDIDIPEDIRQPEKQEPAVDQIVVDTEIALEDYELLYGKFRTLARETGKSLVTVTAVSSDIDWFDEAYENRGQSSGMIIAENGAELLILTKYESIAERDNIHVEFADGTLADAVQKKHDKASDLAVISVNLNSISAQTKEKIRKAEFGNSRYMEAGTPVLALGKADGGEHSLKFGMLTSVHKSQSIVDAEYTVLVTDMSESPAADGVLINLKGEVVGILQNEHPVEKGNNVLTAYAISDIKELIENLSNGRDITYLGIRGVSVTDEAKKEGIPEGIYVTEVEMDSPAMLGGIQNGDVLQMIDGHKIKKMSELSAVLQRLSDRRSISLKGQRQTGSGYKKINYETTLSILE